jgi:DNA-binding transcriptional regulator GbsR (MarR family)
MSDVTLHKGTQIGRVYAALQSGDWLTLSELNAVTGDSISSISAQIRHLRKPAYGSHTIKKRRRGAAERGLYEYRLSNAGGSSDNE